MKFGLGKHLLATDPTKGYKILQAGYFLSLTYALTHFFLKMAILFLYIRIFTLNIKWFKYAIYATIFYVSGWSIGMVVTILSNWYAQASIIPHSSFHPDSYIAAGRSASSGSALTCRARPRPLVYAP